MVALSDQAGTVRAGEDLDIARLQPFLQERLGDTGPITVEQFPGGHSNLTYLLRLGDRELVLRRPPFGSKVRSAHDMAREFRVLSKLHTAYPLAPKALLYCDDPSILNAPFYLMEPIRGLIIRRDPPPGVPFPPETARRLSEVFIDNLARLHGLDYAAVGLGRSGQATRLSRTPGQRLDRALPQFQNARPAGSRPHLPMASRANARNP